MKTNPSVAHEKNPSEGIAVIKASKPIAILNFVLLVFFLSFFVFILWQLFFDKLEGIYVLFAVVMEIFSLIAVWFSLSACVGKITVFSSKGYFRYKSILRTQEVKFSDCRYYKWNSNKKDCYVFALVTKQKTLYMPCVSAKQSADKFINFLVRHKIKNKH